MNGSSALIELNDAEREVLNSGTAQFYGPLSRPSTSLLRWAGFENEADFFRFIDTFQQVIEQSTRVWADLVKSALRVVEIVFISDSDGCGVEWETVTGIENQTTIETIRALQRKVINY